MQLLILTSKYCSDEETVRLFFKFIVEYWGCLNMLSVTGMVDLWEPTGQNFKDF